RKRYKTNSVPQLPSRDVATKEKRRRLSAPPQSRNEKREFVLAQRVRNVVERRIQLGADALHRANRRNGDESGDQAVLNGGRTFRVTDQLNELSHGLRSLVPSTEALRPDLRSTGRMRQF